VNRTPIQGEPFVIQWHLDPRCNLTCSHCYHPADSRGSATTPAQRADTLALLLAFLDGRPEGGRLHFAGGEPFACPDLPDLVAAAGARGVGCRVLSNGTLVSPAQAAALARARVLGVQVSFEGLERVHDGIRGAGSFARALRGVRTLRTEGIQVTLAMTLHQGNLSELGPLAEFAAREADRLYVSRLVPLGRGAELGGRLDATTWGRVLRRLRQLQRRLPIAVALRDPTARPLLAAPWHARHSPVLAGCSAGWGTLTVESDGTVMPCRRMGIPVGRIGEDSLASLLRDHPLLASLRDRDQLQGDCGRCDYRWVCGGCRAFAANLDGNALGQDPHCPWRSWSGRVRILAGHSTKRIRTALRPS
jgi:radical SAM protein with 4Fe4S-binding SPASM domain